MDAATPEDLRSSGTLLAFKNNPSMLTDLVSLLYQSLTRRETLLDLGVGFGYAAQMLKNTLGFKEAVGVDIDEERLAKSSERGIKTVSLDLDQASTHLPFPDESVDLVTCLGVLNYIRSYDCMINETSRVLRPGGIFVTSVPNLGWWVNRISLLFGFQPPHVGVSSDRAVGLPGFYPRQKATKYLHSLTLRALKEILTLHGFDVLKVYGGRENGYETMHNPILRGVVAASENLLSRSSALAVRIITVSRKRVSSANHSFSHYPLEEILGNSSVPAV